MSGPSPLGDGDRVRTGERIGAVGKTGNASGEGCQLHFELWPHGYRNGAPGDPLRDADAAGNGFVVSGAAVACPR